MATDSRSHQYSPAQKRALQVSQAEVERAQAQVAQAIRRLREAGFRYRPDVLGVAHHELGRQATLMAETLENTDWTYGTQGSINDQGNNHVQGLQRTGSD